MKNRMKMLSNIFLMFLLTTLTATLSLASSINETELWEAIDVIWVVLPIIIVLLVFGLIIKMVKGGIK